MADSKTSYERIREWFQTKGGKFMHRYNRPNRDIYIEAWRLENYTFMIEHQEDGGVNVYHSVFDTIHGAGGGNADLIRDINKLLQSL